MTILFQSYFPLQKKHQGKEQILWIFWPNSCVKSVKNPKKTSQKSIDKDFSEIFPPVYYFDLFQHTFYKQITPKKELFQH